MTDSNGITVFAGNLFGLSQLLEDIAEFIDIIKKDITGSIADTIFTGDTVSDRMRRGFGIKKKQSLFFQNLHNLGHTRTIFGQTASHVIVYTADIAEFRQHAAKIIIDLLRSHFNR